MQFSKLPKKAPWLIVIALLVWCDFSYGLQCRQAFKPTHDLGLNYTPYSRRNIPVPEILADPYVQWAIKSEDFRKFLMNNLNSSRTIKDYKDLVDARPRYDEDTGPTKPINPENLRAVEPENLSHEDLLAYLLQNYDLSREKVEPVRFEPEEGPEDHPLYTALRNQGFLSGRSGNTSFVTEALQSLHQTWETLLRKAPRDSRTTILWVPNKYIVAGGRFTESYFWDSYWIMKGLIESGYHTTALGMLENFVHMIEVYGLPANGNRFYYLTRTQMPVLMEMVRLMEDNQLLSFNSQTMNQGNSQKLAARIVRATRDYYENIWKGTPRYQASHGLFKFSDGAGGEGNPDRLVIRPEASIREPRAHETHTQRVYAEFGWDFSYTRCGGNPSNCFPADLNSLMVGYTSYLSEVFAKVGDQPQSQKYASESRAIKRNMDRFLKDREMGLYLDYRYDTETLDPTISAAGFFPFFKKLYPDNSSSRSVLRSLFRSLKPEDHLAIHTTNKEGPGQWDGAWSWANLNEVAFQSLLTYGLLPEAQELAMDYSFMAIRTFFKNDRQFFEKFRAEDGGITIPENSEIYGNETGFGWTNGTLAVFLNYLHSIGKMEELEARLQREFPEGLN